MTGKNGWLAEEKGTIGHSGWGDEWEKVRTAGEKYILSGSLMFASDRKKSLVKKHMLNNHKNTDYRKE